MKKIFAVLIAVLFVLTFTLTAVAESTIEKTGWNFEMSTVDMEGNTVTNDIFSQADLTVVHVWGTFCPPCIREMPELAKWAEELPENVQILGVVCDVSSKDDSNFEKAEKIISKSGVTFTNILVNETLIPLLVDIIGVPSTLFFDRDGNCVNPKVEGAYLDVYKQVIADLIG